MNQRVLRALAFILWALGVAIPLPAADDKKPEHRTWTVAGVKREALVFGRLEATGKPRPLVIIFHGHGGSMRNAAQAFRIHELWPEAIVIYPQGLPTAGQLTDREGKQSGWQIARGDHHDRDLLMFDAFLEQFHREGLIDPLQVFVTGHSNGGAFVYLLWANRGDKITAYASSAAAWFGPYAGLRPAKLLMLCGEKDDLVKFSWQQRTYEGLTRHFDCNPARHEPPNSLTADSKSGAHLVAFVHPGAHAFPSEGPQRITDFFKASTTP